MNNKLYIVALLALGLILHFGFFSHPNEVVFDEVHFGGFISNYYKGEYFFDIHPPTGKLAIAGFGKLFDFKPEISFSEIGNKFPNNDYLALRFLPNLAGALLPLIIYLLLVELGIGRKAAFFGGLFIAFENAILTQSLYILLDGFLLAFGFATLLFYFKYKNSQKLLYIFLTALFGGLAFSIKWTGASFIGLAGLLELIYWIKHHHHRRLIINYAVLIFLPLIIYAAGFWIHFKLLPNSGGGDAFMSQEFQATLKGNGNYNPEAHLGFWSKFIETNEEMYTANQGLTAEHSYSSQWYTWPLMKRPIYYWVNENSRIYLIGNPLIWWASTIAIVYLAISLVLKHTDWRDKNYLPTFIVGGYILNLLPFIGVARVMFLYHYFAALIFAIMALVYLISITEHSYKIFWSFTVAVIISFLFFAPLNYGKGLTPNQYESRVWVESWR